MVDVGHNIRAVTLESRRRAFAKVSEQRALEQIAEPAQVLRTGEQE